MINTDNFRDEHLTVADQSTWYAINFPYDKDPATGAPELWVRLEGNDLTWGSDYTVGVQGLQLTAAPAADQSLVITRNISLTQEQDYQTGLISSEQIEHGFDRSVMRDQYILEGLLELWDETGDTFSQLAPVAWSGDYGDLINTPTFATVANTGDYNDLINKPTIGNGTITITQGGVVKGLFTTNQTGNTTVALDSGVSSVDWSDITNKPSFATVATTGAYSDLTGKPSLAAVATSGAYNDLTGKPALATVATTGAYNDLTGKPTIPTVGNGTITVNQGGVLKGTFTTNQSGNTTIDLDAGGGGAVFPTQTGHAGEFLTTDGSDVAWDVATAVTFRVWGANE